MKHSFFYSNSLSRAFLGLMALSLTGQIYTGLQGHNDFLAGYKPGSLFLEFLCSSKLWFESFQNWRSEFLSILAIIFLSIYLRQHGSSQSKPVNASHQKTGDK